MSSDKEISEKLLKNNLKEYELRKQRAREYYQRHKQEICEDRKTHRIQTGPQLTDEEKAIRLSEQRRASYQKSVEK